MIILQDKDKSMASERLGTHPIFPLMVKLAIPSVIAMAIQALYNVVDSIYVGQLSKEALSALSITFPVQLVLIGVAVGTGIGASSLISRLLGSSERERAANVAEHVILVSFIYGLLGVITGMLFSKPLMQAFTDTPELIEEGSRYIRIILIGSVAMFIPMICNNILRGQGNAMIPMYTMLIGSVLNIILDPFFIFGIWIFPRWGVAGAAFATVLSRIISGGFIIYILFSDKNELKMNIRMFKLDFSILGQVYKVGFPSMLMQLLASFALAGMNKILASFSDTAIAAAGIYFRLQSFVFMPVFGLTQSYMPIMGYNYANGNWERIKKTMKYAFILAFAFTALGLVIFQSTPGGLIRMFNTDAELVSIGIRALRVISITFPIAGPTILASTTFQSFGKGFPGLVLALLRMLVLLLPLMYLFGVNFGLDGVWFAFPVTELLSAAAAWIWLIQTLRKSMHKEIITDFTSEKLA